jgi:hypothetical protein
MVAKCDILFAAAMDPLDKSVESFFSADWNCEKGLLQNQKLSRNPVAHPAYF